MKYEDNGAITLLEIDVPDLGPGQDQLTGGVCGICSWDVATANMGSQMKPMAPTGQDVSQYPLCYSLRPPV